MTDSDVKEKNVDNIKFQLTVENLNDFGNCESKTFEVCGNPWNVYFERGIKYLVVYLQSRVKFNLREPLIILASCELKIISRLYGVKPLADYIIPSVFNFTKSKRPLFIEIDQLMDPTKCFVEDDKCTVEILIEATSLQNVNQTDLLKFKTVELNNDCSQQKFRLVIKRFVEFLGVCSPKFIFGDTSWGIAVSQYENIIYVELIDHEYTKNGSSVIHSTLQLMPFDPNIQPLREDSKDMKLHLNFKWFALTTIEQLIDPNNCFIQNDSFVVEIDMKIEKSSQVRKVDRIIANFNHKTHLERLRKLAKIIIIHLN